MPNEDNSLVNKVFDSSSEGEGDSSIDLLDDYHFLPSCDRPPNPHPYLLENYQQYQAFLDKVSPDDDYLFNCDQYDFAVFCSKYGRVDNYDQIFQLLGAKAAKERSEIKREWELAAAAAHAKKESTLAGADDPVKNKRKRLGDCGADAP